MSISNARIVSQTASDVTVAVDTEQQYDFVTAAMRTDQAWVEGDKADIEDGDTGAGVQTQTQATLATNTFTFTGVAAQYHIGFSAHNVDETEPPVDPPPVGDVPQPTNLTASNITSSAITLNWLAPENKSPSLYYNYSADIEQLANGADMPPSLNISNEGSQNVKDAGVDKTSIYAAKVSNTVTRFRGDSNSIKTEIYRNSDTDFQNRQELLPYTAAGNDKYRPTIKRKSGYAFSTWTENLGQPNFYRVMGQYHDLAPTGTPGLSPIFMHGTSVANDQWRSYGSVQTLAINPSNTDGKSAIQQNYVPIDYTNDMNRWMDHVWIFTWDAIGEGGTPGVDDGVAPYQGTLEYWRDGVKLIDYAGPTFTNDAQSPGLYPKFGIYGGYRPNVTTPPGGWVNTTQRTYYGGVRISDGAAESTYENLNAAGRVTAIEILQETAPGQSQVIKTLAPSYNSWTLTGLPGGTQYKFFVRCRYDAETSTPSGTITVSTL